MRDSASILVYSFSCLFHLTVMESSDFTGVIEMIEHVSISGNTHHDTRRACIFIVVFNNIFYLFNQLFER